MAKKRREGGQGLLRKRKDGRWEGRIVIDYDEKGLPITKTVTSKSKTECQAKMEKLKESLGKTNNKINTANNAQNPYFKDFSSQCFSKFYHIFHEEKRAKTLLKKKVEETEILV